MADVTKVKASDGTIYDINDVNDYTKDETDALLAGKAGVGDSYTKAEDDALLAAKADSTSVENALALKANVVDVYSKTEADNLLAGKADTGVSYTKAEDDALLADKANSADVYTITQTDGLLDAKAGVDDTSTTATMATWSASKLAPEFQSKADSSDVYTKAEVNALIGGIKMFPRLDYAHPLHTFSTGNLSYTATEDCWLLGFFTASTTSCTLTIDGTTVGFNEYSWYANSSANHAGNGMPLTFIPAGSVVAVTNAMDNLHIFKEVTS